MSRVDLYVHSTASDGRFSPAEIVSKAAERGLTVIALADHDTVDGIVPALTAAKDFPGLMVTRNHQFSISKDDDYQGKHTPAPGSTWTGLHFESGRHILSTSLKTRKLAVAVADALASTIV